MARSFHSHTHLNHTQAHTNMTYTDVMHVIVIFVVVAHHTKFPLILNTLLALIQCILTYVIRFDLFPIARRRYSCSQHMDARNQTKNPQLNWNNKCSRLDGNLAADKKRKKNKNNCNRRTIHLKHVFYFANACSMLSISRIKRDFFNFTFNFVWIFQIRNKKTDWFSALLMNSEHWITFHISHSQNNNE